MTYPDLLEAPITGGVTTGFISAYQAMAKRFNATFYVGKPAAGSSTGKDKTQVSEAIAAALACGQTTAVVEFSGGVYDVGDLTTLQALPPYGSGVQLTLRAPFLTTLHFSIDQGAGTFAVMGSGTESDLYFHTFDGISFQGPGERDVIGDPPTNTIGGGPTEMSGIWCGSRMILRNLLVSGFNRGIQIMGNHITVRSVNCPNNLDGIYWAQAYGNSGDVLFDNCALDGNLRSSHCIANYSIATFKMTKGHLGFSPYAFYCEAGRTGGSALAMGGVILDGTSVEFCGNGWFYDPDQFARIQNLTCIQVGDWSTSAVTYRIPGSAAASWINVAEMVDVDWIDGMPLAGFDGALFDVTSYCRMRSNRWEGSYASCVAAGQPWMLISASQPPKIVLTDTESDSEARVMFAVQTVTAGQVLEHRDSIAFSCVQPYGYYGAGVRGLYAGVALNGATAGSRTGVVCVTRHDAVPVLVDAAPGGSYYLVASGTVAGKADAVVYDGTATSTGGRPLIGAAYFGAYTAGGAAQNTHLCRDG